MATPRQRLDAVEKEIVFLSRAIMFLGNEVKGLLDMKEDFTALTAAVVAIADEVAAVASVLSNPQVDNNNQAIIDGLTGRLNTAAEALKGVIPASAEAPAVEVPTATPTDSGTASPVDSGTSDAGSDAPAA